MQEDANITLHLANLARKDGDGSNDEVARVSWHHISSRNLCVGKFFSHSHRRNTD